MRRREFLIATAAAITTASCGSPKPKTGLDLPEPTEAQKAKRRPERESTVALVKCPTYEDDIFARMKELMPQVNLPDLKGKRVVLKPNMVEFQPGHPITTIWRCWLLPLNLPTTCRHAKLSSQKAQVTCATPKCS